MSGTRSFLLNALTLSVSLTGLLTEQSLFAQTQFPQFGADRVTNRKQTYRVEVRVLMQPNPVYAVKAQQWNRVFQDIGYPVIFDSNLAGKQPGLANIELADTVRVQLTGVMDSRGGIVFGKTKYLPTQAEALKEFLDRLKAYGADGPPQESPTWGLSDEQFQTVLKLFSPTVEKPVRLRTPVDAIESIQIPAVFRVRYTEAASKLVLSEIDSDADSVIEVQGLSTGSALAVVLAQYGLGFRTMADSDGGFILEVDAGDESSNLWPVGWKNTKPMNVILPPIYKSMTVDNLEDVEVTSLIHLLAEQLKIPHYYSSYSIKSRGIALADLLYSQKAGKVPPAGLMRRIGDRYDLGLDIRTDEAGNVFLWITTRQDYVAFRERFSHVIPGRSTQK